MFRVAIQAMIGRKVIASEHINPFRKGKKRFLHEFEFFILTEDFKIEIDL